MGEGRPGLASIGQGLLEAGDGRQGLASIGQGSLEAGNGRQGLASIGKGSLEVGEVVAEMAEIGCPLTLTAGLPESYSTFIVTLDNLPTDDLTLPNVITHLLNEEVRQSHSIQSSSEHRDSEALAVQVTKSNKKKTPLSDITCYNCGGKGHYKLDCPSGSMKTEKPETALTATGNDSGVKMVFGPSIT